MPSQYPMHMQMQPGSLQGPPAYLQHPQQPPYPPPQGPWEPPAWDNLPPPQPNGQPPLPPPQQQPPPPPHQPHPQPGGVLDTPMSPVNEADRGFVPSAPLPAPGSRGAWHVATPASGVVAAGFAWRYCVHRISPSPSQGVGPVGVCGCPLCHAMPCHVVTPPSRGVRTATVRARAVRARGASAAAAAAPPATAAPRWPWPRPLAAPAARARGGPRPSPRGGAVTGPARRRCGSNG